MGEAKRRSVNRANWEALSRPIKRARFDLYALGARLSWTRIMSEERSHWSDKEERVLGAVIRDTTDDDFGWILLARDKIGRFRCADLETSITKEGIALDRLRERIAKAVVDGDFAALGDQGDETNYPTDVLAVPLGTNPGDLHPHFRMLMQSPGRHPSRSVFKEIGPWLAPTDPHFVREFQFSQFDQRLWEMYLWATFREMRFDVTQPEAPDFLCKAPAIAFAVEATTVGPSTSGVLATHPDPKTPEEIAEFLANYMPMKFGSSLTKKLNKKDKDGRSYWERPDTKDVPFLLAIADFHISGSEVSDGKHGSMTYTHSALWPYLYGHRVEWEIIDGQLIVRALKGESHTYNGKTVETGFFDLPGAENVSAIIFSNAGTLAKFDRMGIAAGFMPENHKYMRVGYRYNPAANAVHPVPFAQEIGGEDYVEFWSDELQIFHNPRARVPLGQHVFAGVTQHLFKDGNQVSITPDGAVLASYTWILHLKDRSPTDSPPHPSDL
jgi:hypothetical protein